MYGHPRQPSCDNKVWTELHRCLYSDVRGRTVKSPLISWRDGRMGLGRVSSRETSELGQSPRLQPTGQETLHCKIRSLPSYWPIAFSKTQATQGERGHYSPPQRKWYPVCFFMMEVLIFSLLPENPPFSFQIYATTQLQYTWSLNKMNNDRSMSVESHRGP